MTTVKQIYEKFEEALKMISDLDVIVNKDYNEEITRHDNYMTSKDNHDKFFRLSVDELKETHKEFFVKENKCEKQRYELVNRGRLLKELITNAMDELIWKTNEYFIQHERDNYQEFIKVIEVKYDDLKDMKFYLQQENL